MNEVYRIIDANLNRITEALRVLEEISRFILNDKEISEKFKNDRHKLATYVDRNYSILLDSRDTVNDVGVGIFNPTSKKSLMDVFKANVKRLQQCLRVLAEYYSILGEDNAAFEQMRYESYTMEKVMFDKLSKKVNLHKLSDKKLYLVTDRNKFADDNAFLDALAAALKGGVQIVQLREKTATAKEIVNLAQKVKELCGHFNALFIINDRVDIAQIVGVDGVHLGQDDIDIHSARKLLGNDVIIGISTHEPKHALKAVEDGADYIGVGPVFETPTKPGKKSVGLEYVEWATQNVNIPWYAIGGIDLTNVSEVVAHGATRTAVVRAIINAENPEAQAKEFIVKLNSKSN
ncbi:MAG: thiamine phosphate synthase [bacterium]